MTMTPYVDEEELRRLEAETLAREQALDAAAPEYNPQTNAPETMYREATPAENKAAGNVQPVTSPAEQGMKQLFGGDGKEYTTGDRLRYMAEQSLAVPAGLIDFGLDAVGRIPGAEWIDDSWDAQTKFKNPAFQKVREVSSILLPSIAVGIASRNLTAVGKTAAISGGGGALARGLAALGINLAGDVAVNAISDQSEEDNLTTIVKEAAPWIPVPDALVIKDTDSPDIRRQKNIYESGAISVIGDIIGYSAAAGRGIMDWFKPNDTTAQAYKSSEAMVNADSATATRLSELDTQRASLKEELDQVTMQTPMNDADLVAQGIRLSDLEQQLKGIDDEAAKLGKQYTDTGASDLTESPLESFVERQQTSRDLQVDEVGKGRLLDDPEGASGVWMQ